MGVPSQPLPQPGQPNSTEDLKVKSALNEIQTILSGNVDGGNLANNAVNTSKIADQTIMPGDLAPATMDTFLKLVSAGDHKISFGSVTCTTVGNLLRGVAQHGLGANPAVVLADGKFGGGGFYNLQYVGCSFADATNIQLDVEGVGITIQPGSTCALYWLAIA